MPPLVSVIVPVYLGEPYIRETIASVARQTWKDFEIIAVNDGSPDESGKVLAGCQQVLGERMQVITVPNGGVSRARNLGATQARGEYIAFLDQDDLWEPCKLERQIDLFARDPSLGVVYSNLALIDGKGVMVEKKALRLGQKHRGAIFPRLLFYNFIPISSVVVRADLFRSIGGFDPAYTLSEDLDLLLRLSRATGVDFVDEPLTLYRVHPGNLSRNVDCINEETEQIVALWKVREPAIFRRHPLKYLMFRANLLWMKCKSLVT
ncbi:MAG: glycosyltransferase [Methanomicrobiales archaeon]|nr:glycosyltransferase [Methanomicrobiales archaeon]